jgi:hypothetical protein
MIKKLVYENGKALWIEKESIRPFRQGKEDLTVDGYISKHGGIFSHADNKIHTTKKSYLDGIKSKGYHIKDYN